MRTLDRRIEALESLPVVQQPASPELRNLSPAEAYDLMMRPGELEPVPDDGLTPTERYLRMLDAPMKRGEHGHA